MLSLRPLWQLLGLDAPIRCKLHMHIGYARPNYCSDEIDAESGIHFHCTRCGEDRSLDDPVRPPPGRYG